MINVHSRFGTYDLLFVATNISVELVFDQKTHTQKTHKDKRSIF